MKSVHSATEESGSYIPVTVLCQRKLPILWYTIIWNLRTKIIGTMDHLLNSQVFSPPCLLSMIILSHRVCHCILNSFCFSICNKRLWLSIHLFSQTPPQFSLSIRSILNHLLHDHQMFVLPPCLIFRIYIYLPVLPKCG